MKISKLIILSICLIAFNQKALASYPTMEGLFRNGTNAEVSASLIMVKLMVSKETSHQLMESSPTETEVPVQEVMEEKKKNPVFVKLLFSEDADGRVQVIQAIYRNGKMEDNALANIRYISNLTDKVLNSDTKFALFYAVMSSLVLNRSEEMNAYLKKVSKNYRSNKDLIDREKLALYEKYKRYLKLIKEDESLKENMDNPMKPSDPEVAKVVASINDKPFMMKDPNIELVKSTGGFIWKGTLDVMEAIFENETLRLEKMSYGQVDKNLVFNFDNYVLFDGSHELPKFIKLIGPVDTVNFRVLSLTHLNLGNRNMLKRFSEYKDLLSDSEAKQLDRDLFILN